MPGLFLLTAGARQNGSNGELRQNPSPSGMRPAWRERQRKAVRQAGRTGGRLERQAARQPAADMEPLLDAQMADDTEAFAKALKAVRTVALFTPNCVLFDKNEEAHVYEREFFGSWIVVAKRGEIGRWYSFKAWWD